MGKKIPRAVVGRGAVWLPLEWWRVPSSGAVCACLAAVSAYGVDGVGGGDGKPDGGFYDVSHG